jgi:hypothetical protein
MLIENYVPVVKWHGLNTDKAVVFGSTLSVAGVSTFTGVATFTGTPVFTAGIPSVAVAKTITNIDAQTAAPTIAQLIGGIIIHTSVTGAGTVTVPTGTAMSAGTTGAVGTTVKWLYYNDGNQTVTVTPATDHTLVGGTAAVTTGKHMEITSVCTAAGVWVSFLQTLM